MSTTVLGALLNAQINFRTLGRVLGANPIYNIAMAQLDNAIEALENSRSLDFVIQDSIGDEIRT